MSLIWTSPFTAPRVQSAAVGCRSRFSRWQPASIATASAALRKREHIQRAPLAGGLGQILGRRDEPQGGALVARVQVADHDAARPTADPGEHRDVLLAVGADVTDWLAD